MNKLSSTDPQPATIFDVARLAGVSIKTVSRVANAEPNVRAATRSRVEGAINLLGYRANPQARYLGSLRVQRTVPVAEAPAQETGS